jgi:gamma-glutamyl-gamma-aminobutyrate hydrolase PuuD
MANKKTTQPKPEPEVEAKEVEKKEGYRVQVLQDHIVDYPDLYCKIFLAGPSAVEASFAEMFARASCYFTDDLRDADICVFTGGVDVCPSLYGLKDNEHHPKTFFSKQRDQEDMALYADCVLGRIPMLGICRGAQFLHVMNGGKLYQHVDNHTGDHPIWDLRTKVMVQKTSSTHHQMVMKNDSKTNPMEVLAVAHKSRKRFVTANECEEGQIKDIEAFFYPNNCCLGIQGHPEFRGYPMFTKWVLKTIEDRIIHNHRVKLESNMYRVQKHLVLDGGDEAEGNVL